MAVLGKSRSESTSSSVSVAGSSSAKAGTEVQTNAVGIDGGAGVDGIVNRGSIRVGPGEGDDPWMSELVTTASSFGFSGDVSAQSAAYAQTGSTGIGGGSGNDDISNQGELTVVATARSSASQGTLNIFGSADGGGRSGAFTRAAGIDGGDGDDALASTTTLDVTAQSHLLQDGTTFSFAGSGALDAALEAGTEAVGLDGGAGSDTLTTAGTIAVDSTSTLISQGGGNHSR